MKYYVLYDRDGMDAYPIYGIYTNEATALTNKVALAKQMTEDCFKTDPKESGLDREFDYDWVYKECLDTIGIQEIEELNKLMEG